MAIFSGVVTVGKEARLSTVGNGDEVLNFTGALSLPAGKKQDGTYHDNVTQWFDVKLFKPNDYLKATVKKGVSLLITGQLGASKWTNKSGQEQVSLTLTISPPLGRAGIAKLPNNGVANYTSAPMTSDNMVF